MRISDWSSDVCSSGLPNLAPMSPPASPRDQQIAQILLFITPALFTANMVLARATADFIPPVAVAGMRWLGVVLVLLPFCGPELWRCRSAVRREIGRALCREKGCQ